MTVSNENIRSESVDCKNDYSQYINNWFSVSGDIDDFIFYNEDK